MCLVPCALCPRHRLTPVFSSYCIVTVSLTPLLLLSLSLSLHSCCRHCLSHSTLVVVTVSLTPLLLLPLSLPGLLLSWHPPPRDNGLPVTSYELEIKDFRGKEGVEQWGHSGSGPSSGSRTPLGSEPGMRSGPESGTVLGSELEKKGINDVSFDNSSSANKKNSSNNSNSNNHNNDSSLDGADSLDTQEIMRAAKKKSANNMWHRIILHTNCNMRQKYVHLKSA